MDERKLEVLLTAVRVGSFNKAAEELHCTQSAVTQMMNGLEEELGCVILERDHRGVRLTPAGEALWPYLQKAYDSLSQLSKEAGHIADEASKKTKPIRIGSFHSIANAWLMDAVRRYEERWPEARFNIRIGTDLLADWLADGSIDMALGDWERCRRDGFQWIPLGIEDPYYAAVQANLYPPEKKTITLEELRRHKAVLASRNAVDLLPDLEPGKWVNIDSDDDQTILTMVAHGMGVTILPKLSLAWQPEGVRVLPLDPVVNRQIGIAYKGQKTRKEVKRFAAFLEKYFTV